MSKFRFTISLLAVVFCTLAAASLAQAQATRTWVSGVGDDANPCSRTAPCKTFAGAISKTAMNGEINCLDPGGFGALTITKSITVDCHEILAGISHPVISGITINYDAFNQVTDVRKTVRIRNINFLSADTGTISIRILGATGTNSANSEVVIEDCLLDGNQANVNPNGRGISDVRAGGGKLLVTNTTVRNMGGTGIAIAPASGGTKIDVTINNVRVFNCAFGFVGSSGSRTQIFNSTFHGNTTGIAGEGPAGASEINVDHSNVTSNGTGVSNLGGTTIRLSNTNVTSNTTQFSGQTFTYGNNQVNGGAVGTAPSGILPT